MIYHQDFGSKVLYIITNYLLNDSLLDERSLINKNLKETINHLINLQTNLNDYFY